MAAPGSCVPMLSLQRLWFARHLQPAYAPWKLDVLRGRGTSALRKLRLFCSDDHLRLLQFDTYLGQIVKRGHNLRVKLDTPPILRVRSPSSATPVWKGRTGYARGGWPRSSTWASAAAAIRRLLTNNFASLATNSEPTLNPLPDDQIPIYQPETMADAIGDRPADAVNVREKLEGELQLCQ